MTTALYVAPRPCNTCPYACATPPGIWHPDEYAKLRTYDDDFNPALATFLCHQTKYTGVDTACKGWLAVHPDHVAVRIAVLTGQLTLEQVDEPCPVDVYGSGNEAADAGMAGVDAPDDDATAAIDRLMRKGVGKIY